MRFSLQQVGGLSFTLLWLSCFFTWSGATDYFGTKITGPAYDSLPHTLEDVVIRPTTVFSPGSLSSDSVRTHLASTNPFDAPARPINPIPGYTRVQKRRTPWTLKQTLVNAVRREHGLKRNCDHTRRKRPCDCGIPPHILEEIIQKTRVAPEPAIGNNTDTALHTGFHVIRFFSNDSIPSLAETSLGSPPWPNFSQPISVNAAIFKEAAPFGEPSSLDARNTESCVEDSSTGSVDQNRMYLKPDMWPATQQQVIDEVRGIYAGLVMVEKKCVEIDQKLSKTNNKLSGEQWQALIALHRTLLHEQHDFFLASQHPSSSAALRRLATKYDMPVRMRHGIHSFLELQRHRLPDSRDHMLVFVDMAYSMMALLMESAPSFVEIWIECLDDLSRYQTLFQERDTSDQDMWAAKADSKSPDFGWAQHHVEVPPPPTLRRRTQPQNDPVSTPLADPTGEDTSGSQGVLKATGSAQYDRNEQAPDLPSMVEASANNPDVLHPSSTSSSLQDLSASDAANEPDLFMELMGDSYLGETIQDVAMPDLDSDDPQDLESREPLLSNPLSHHFNPQMTFSTNDNEPASPVLRWREDYTLPEMESDPEFDIWIVREIINKTAVIVLDHKRQAMVRRKSDEDDDETVGHALNAEELRDDPSIANSNALRRSVIAPEQDPRQMPTLLSQTEADRAVPLDRVLFRGTREMSESIFFLLLLSLERSSPGIEGCMHGSDSFKVITQIMLLFIALLLCDTNKL